MSESDTFKMRISPEEKAMLAHITRHFEQHSQASTLKTFIRETYRLIKADKKRSRKKVKEFEEMREK